MSVDELMGLLKPMQELGINDKSKISQIEQLQVYMVWVFLYEFNTCGSLTTSDCFHIDDNALDNLISFDTHVPLKSYYRHFLPDLAKYTIWEGTCWAFTFDEMREMSYAFPKMIVNPKLFIQDTLSDMKLLRTVVRLTRLTQYNMDISENVNSIVDLHERILASLSKINADYSYFDSLKYFVYGSTENPPIPKIKFLPMSITESVVRLLMLSFLHLRVLNSNASNLILFPLSADGIRFYTSQDILYTTTNAVCYLIQQLSIPLQPHDTLFEPFQYPHDEYIRCCSQPVDSSCPSPALVSYILCFLINGIVSASLKAYVDKNSDPLLRQSLYKMVETTVLPTLDKIANIWKGARVFPDRIRASLSVF
ncbi:hypothetical protein HDV02_004746 [Globomyces sp. JEL0801]|nr:hypothetical protein HDV02_004746 [Globomyces sp. JEL0801]